MILDQQSELAGKNQMALTGAFDVTNPYLNTYNTSLTYTHTMRGLFFAGIEGNAYSSEKSKYNKKLESDLNVFGITADDDRPSHSLLAIVGIKLLQGRVNLLGMRALPFRFNARLGAGYLWLDEGRRSTVSAWGLEPQIFLSRRIGLSLRFDQDVENVWSSKENIYRNRLGLSTAYVF